MSKKQQDRNEPITEDWLRALGPIVRDDKVGFGVNVGPGVVLVSRIGWHPTTLKVRRYCGTNYKWLLVPYCSLVVTTRGDLLDLLAIFERLAQGAAK
jgi:hypothetical protein